MDNSRRLTDQSGRLARFYDSEARTSDLIAYGTPNLTSVLFTMARGQRSRTGTAFQW